MVERKNMPDAFEQRLKESLEQFEVPYNSADWAQMELALAGGSRSWGRAGTALALLAGALLLGGAVYFTHRNAAAPTVAELVPQGAMSEVKDEIGATATSASSANNERPAASVPASSSTTVRSGSSEEKEPARFTVAPQTRVSVVTGAKTAATPATAPSTPANAPVEEKPLTTKNSPETAFRASASEGCPGTPVEFKVERMPEDGIYLWNFGDGSFSNKANPEHTFAKAGNYQVMLSMSAAGVGTIHNKPSSDMIVIHEAPKAAFNVMKQEYDGHIPSVHFENRTMGAKEYHWEFGDGATSSIGHPDHIFKKKGIYEVELTVTSELGCVNKSIKEVRIDHDYNLDAATVFSPNGDGVQETFMPEALKTLGVKFHLAVYDPNGVLLYETKDATAPWTGKPQNQGAVCEAGEYVWVVDVSESLHLNETYTGKVKLMK